MVVDFIATNNIRFEIKEKEKATKALAVSVRLFHFVNADRKALSHNESPKFNNPILLGIKHVIIEKSKTPLKRNLKSSILKYISIRFKVTMGCVPVLITILNTNMAHWLAMPFLPIFRTQLIELKHT